METFNLKKIINANFLDQQILAKELFPENKFPNAALKRILDGKAFLDTNQLQTLAKILRINVQQLFADSDWWHKEMNNEKIIFKKNNFRVELFLNNLTTVIYKNDKIISSEVIIPDNNIKLSEYLNLVDKTILNLI